MESSYEKLLNKIKNNNKSIFDVKRNLLTNRISYHLTDIGSIGFQKGITL